jgi:hypothetical protein
LVQVVAFVGAVPTTAQLLLPLGLRSMSKLSSFGLFWLSTQLSWIEDADAREAARFDGGARFDTVVLVVVETTVLVVDPGASVVLVELDVLVLVVDVSGVALAVFE